ncbi:EAL domain-containing protein [Glaciimonas sp. PCH181]|uniref:sensor domain-containing protein n=1 Tax=Glaciimonas sp. PCH181 TaxID=2133943 RepID=UPI000D3444BA|nr:EAL domain-containing protein [Glaciimonas sp. PCH181]PUA20624.1 bifunctional diguanylate cyclase/phosphodiesterase [Glaciimonas sp. PCH181]
MHDSASPACPVPIISERIHTSTPPISFSLRAALTQVSTPDFVEQAASFGRWWHDVETGQLVLSVSAAEMLGVEAGWQPTLESCSRYVLPDDVLMLVSALTTSGTTGMHDECEFRVMNESGGLRWLRLMPLPQTAVKQDVRSGILLETTSSKHAAIRERLSIESTQFLVGTDTLGDAVTKVIQLVCENLGWEWGAYWAVESDQIETQQLACKYFWHDPQYPLSAFTDESCTLRMASGAGLVGQVWQSGEARWIEDLVRNQGFLRYNSAEECRLRSGYVFPVVYVTEDGHRHSPGVLEFYSRLSRQREAQLPHLSATIGALIAQTAQRLEQQETIRQLAQIDGLTELANRTHFYRMLDKKCADTATSDATFGLIFIDLDRFKPVNDAFGHEAGNVVLQEFAQRLSALAPAGSYVGRLGGDEFAILLIPEDAILPLDTLLDVLGQRVLQAARLPFMFENNEITVSASIGISMFPENGMTSPELLRSADAAMYRIKKTGRNALSFFSTSTSHTLAVEQSDVAQRLTMEAQLHQALADNAFFLEYQPIFDSSGQHIHAVEALIRWRRPNGEVVRPDIFIPIAEQSSLIVHIGRWVLRQACNDLAQLHRSGFSGLQMHVNMAASEFTDSDLPNELSAILKASGIHSSHLCLELTEGMVMQQPGRVIPVMRALRQLGVDISLDDFGMGYSSLSRLKNLPISSIKIDRSFVSGLPNQKEDKAIVRTILELGRHMNLRVIAEGVETDAQLAYLRQYGCSLIQGFVLSRPRPIDTLIALYQRV